MKITIENGIQNDDQSGGSQKNISFVRIVKLFCKVWTGPIVVI